MTVWVLRILPFAQPANLQGEELSLDLLAKAIYLSFSDWFCKIPMSQRRLKCEASWVLLKGGSLSWGMSQGSL